MRKRNVCFFIKIGKIAIDTLKCKEQEKNISYNEQKKFVSKDKFILYVHVNKCTLKLYLSIHIKLK